MNGSELLQRLGVLILDGFLDESSLGSLLLAGRQAADRGHVVNADGVRVDLQERDVWETRESDALVRARVSVAAVMPRLARHFATPLTRAEGTALLAYRAGGYYRAHRDRIGASGAAAADARRRQVSVVVFVNAQKSASTPDGYEGGVLTIYGLLDDPRSRDIGFPVPAVPGRLVAFRSSLVHEVTPVLSGERYTLVDWFGDGDA